jgi:hypothetical protein
MHINKSLGLFIPLIFFCSVAIADDALNVGDLARIQSETILIKAQVKREEVQAELARKQQDRIRHRWYSPVLKSIYGADKLLLATFIYPGNIVVEANEGDLIPGGYRVSKIYSDINKVELIKDKHKFQVGFSALAPLIRSQGSGAPFVPGISR